MNRDEDVFAQAAELAATARGAFLDDACAGDPALRGRVEALLRGHDQSTGFLSQPVAGRGPVNAPAGERASDVVGRYKLLEKIGEGGCGVVWMAEQSEPVRRRVALKIIKLGMDTREVVARFEAERQALALMDHPNIAKVLDGGTTESGRPYFVMDLVRGLPITRYCDEARLTPVQRVELFIAVCQAVQHAHQKGVIHRDLKPSNILVTVNDGAAVPKVIDFGIAKATQGPLTDKTLFTAFRQFIGTPVYMSPEQADLSSVDIDTRADIYSLGVLLYELLTGAPPFDPKTLLSGGVDEIRRIIREVEPARPSTRVSTFAEAERTTRSRQRGLAFEELRVALRGDLDWIVMRCLEKERARRYETANGLAADLRRYLAHEPVVARPPSAGYRFRKLVRRNRLVFAAGATVFVSLIAGLAVATTSLVRERSARQEARRAEQLAGDSRQNAERLLAYVVSELGEELDQLGQLPVLRKLNRQILEYYEQIDPALHTRETRAGLALARTGINTAGWLNHDRSDDFRLGEPAAEKRFEEALSVMQELEESGPLTPFIRVAYAGVLWGKAGHQNRAGRGKAHSLPLLEKAESILRPALADPKWGDWADRFTVKIILGRGYAGLDYSGRQSAPSKRAVIAEFQRALDRVEERDRRGMSGRRAGLQAAEVRWRLSSALSLANQPDEAREVNATARAQLQKLLDREPFLVGAITCQSLVNLQFASQCFSRWRFDESLRARDEAIRNLEQVWKTDPSASTVTNWLAQALLYNSLPWRFRDFELVEAGTLRSLELSIQPNRGPDSHINHRKSRLRLAQLYAATSRDTEAEHQLVEAQAVARRFVDERPWLTRAEKLAHTIGDEAERCSVEVERLNWSAVRAGAQRILQADTAGTDLAGNAEETASTNSNMTAHRLLLQAAFETGDYATARRELDAWNPPTTLLRADAAIENRFQRVLVLLTRIHVIARAGELDAARTELSRIWGEAEEIFDTGRDHVFVQIEHARALSIRAEVEAADAITKRGWLERAAGLLRPAAAAGRLTRYEREVLLDRIERQLAEFEGVTAR